MITPGNSAAPPTSAELLKWGFARLAPTKTQLELHPEFSELLPQLSRVADPDMALLQLSRLADEDVDLQELARTLGEERWSRQLALLGGSRALGDYQVTNRGPWVDEIAKDARAGLLTAVGADPTQARPVASGQNQVDRMRASYRAHLIDIAAADLNAADPLEHLAIASRQLADLADAAIEAALAIARAEHDPEASIPLTIISLGKTGAQELNYISDVDVMFLTSNEMDADAIKVASEMARTISACCSAPNGEPPLWVLDAGLRPEGRDGALVRSVGSALDYYKRWAADWEFQALLKARPAAGDLELGEEFVRAVEPLVWSAAARPGFVKKVRDMRGQVEDSVRGADRGRELKLSAGGLRDVEFTVQLLQLVHGQADRDVRVANTLLAIEALSARGYVGRQHATELACAYRFLRLIEHRVQLRSMRRTHTLPTGDEAQRALARAVDPQEYPTWDTLERALSEVRRKVRELHEDVYYRPIVAATASIGTGNVLLAEEAEDRLRAIGYQHPEGALRSIAALTEGTTRRAMIQRNLAPVLIEWLAEGADPDMGILSFRTLSEQIGSSHWYLGLLRDSSSAASRLCRVLSNSKWAQSALSAIPRAVAWLDSDRDLAPTPEEDLRQEAAALLGRHATAESAMQRVSSIVTREVTRAGLSDITGGVEPWRPSLSQAVDIAVDAALVLALREREEDTGRAAVRMCAVAMGRYGGRETSYASDVDIVFVHEALPGIDAEEANTAAIAVANRARALLQAHRQEAMISIDLDLRPEGKSGALSRSLESYQEYYRRWASVWERHALVRARYAGGAAELGKKFIALADQIRWDRSLTPADVREIRLLKARMENERLPRGIDPSLHVKLGPGGLTDVEWVVQLLQLQNAHEFPSLRTTSTLPAIEALVELELLKEQEGEDLRRAWCLASQIRSANVLASARLQPERIDTLPRRPEQGTRVAALLQLGDGGESSLFDQWRHASRRARAVMDEKFWA